MLNSKIETKVFTGIFLVPRQWMATKRLARRKKVSAAAIVREALGEYLKKAEPGCEVSGTAAK